MLGKNKKNLTIRVCSRFIPNSLVFLNDILCATDALISAINPIKIADLFITVEYETKHSTNT